MSGERDGLAEHADDFDAAAEAADTRAEADANAALAAFARGEPVPCDVARRIVERARGEE